MRRSLGHHTVALTLDAHGNPPSEVQLLPAGSFRAIDGRPTDVPAWNLTALSAQRLVDQRAARTNRTVIDYEHQTLHARANGQPAPAAGWYDTIEWREGSGLWALHVEWTDRARQMIAAGEYRYLSPVFSYDARGQVTRVLHAALTNDPGLDGMAAVAAASSLASEPLMDDLRERLLYLLNLPLTTTDDELLAELDKLKAMISGSPAAATFEGLGALITALTARVATADGQLVALRASHQPNEVVTDLQNRLAVLTAEANARAVEDLIRPALADGRLLPAQEAWARALGASQLEALTQYLETTQPIAALTGTQTGGAPMPRGQRGERTPDEVATAARAWQAEQAALGNTVSVVDAVAHVTRQPAA